MLISQSILLMLLLGMPLFTRATTESEFRTRIAERNAQIQKLEEEIAAYQKTLDQTSKESKTLQGEIKRAETQIKKLSSDITLTENKLYAAQLEIEALDREITDTETHITIQRSSLAETLQTLEERDAETLLEIFLKHERISDFLADVEHIEDIEASIQDDLVQLRQLKTTLEEERKSRENHTINLSLLTGELRDRKIIEESVKKEKNAFLAKTKNKERQYQQLVEDRERQRQQMLEEIQKIEEELQKLINPSRLPQPHTGVLAWPTTGSVVLTQTFGTTPESKILYNGKPHNGIDIRAAVGTPLYAADNGVVRETGDTDIFPGCLSYGKWILLDHPTGLSTLYAHLSLLLVSKGKTVTRGELIGYTGETGYATGPHLHFTVYDSTTVQFRSSKIAGSTCAFLPYGGYVNPLAYL